MRAGKDSAQAGEDSAQAGENSAQAGKDSVQAGKHHAGSQQLCVINTAMHHSSKGMF